MQAALPETDVTKPEGDCHGGVADGDREPRRGSQDGMNRERRDHSAPAEGHEAHDVSQVGVATRLVGRELSAPLKQANSALARSQEHPRGIPADIGKSGLWFTCHLPPNPFQSA